MAVIEVDNMVKDIRFAYFWGCDECNAIMTAIEWMAREIISYDSGKAFYACPKCLNKVELHVVTS